MSKANYTYKSYDYSFLEKREGRCFTTAKHGFAKTIGFDLAEVQPMGEPVGQLYWMDYPFETTVTTDDTTYEPIRDNGMPGGWEVRLTPPTPVTVTDTPVTSTASTYMYTQDEEKPQRQHLPSLYPHYTDIERYRKARNKAYLNNVKLKRINTYTKYYGKKV